MSPVAYVPAVNTTAIRGTVAHISSRRPIARTAA